jgi:hypothetical protein
MAHAIIRGENGRRHEVDSEGADITLEIFFGDEVVEIAVAAPDDPAPSDKRRMALLNLPRDLFNHALAHKTMLDEFYRVALPQKALSQHRRAAGRPGPVDDVRTHQGRWCYEKTPM